ncbi:TIM-barrel domain-containing protein [Streptomyces sp. B21-105]
MLIRWLQYGTFSPLMRLHGNRLSHDQDFCTEATGGHCHVG